jgi:hypothetical protein
VRIGVRPRRSLPSLRRKRLMCASSMKRISAQVANAAMTHACATLRVCQPFRRLRVMGRPRRRSQLRAPLRNVGTFRSVRANLRASQLVVRALAHDTQPAATNSSRVQVA